VKLPSQKKERGEGGREGGKEGGREGGRKEGRKKKVRCTNLRIKYKSFVQG
jgi:hypothetical protein